MIKNINLSPWTAGYPIVHMNSNAVTVMVERIFTSGMRAGGGDITIVTRGPFQWIAVFGGSVREADLEGTGDGEAPLR